MRLNKIDIVNLKKRVKNKELQFYLLDGYIYCKDCRTKESVIVGDYEETVINSNGIFIRKKGKSKQLGYSSTYRCIYL